MHMVLKLEYKIQKEQNELLKELVSSIQDFKKGRYKVFK